MIGRNKLQALVAIQIFWLALVCVLGAWWGRLALRQARRIAELEVAAGMAPSVARGEWARTQHMLFWESTTYFALILVITGFLFWLHWRDLMRVRSIQAFFASVTHELRTPLTSIRLQAESIADSSHDASQKELIDRLLEDTTRLESQVDRTLELARVEGGGELFLRPLPIQSWLNRQIPVWSSSYRDRIRFETDFRPDQNQDQIVEADTAALQVILKNLVENSIKHSQSRQPTLRIAVNGPMLRFEDDGAGYAGNPQRLGELFYRGAASQGSGVGLYLIRVLMKRMGGQARFGKGERGFRVDLEFVPAKKGASP
jgi:signal transduction histidine kinase